MNISIIPARGGSKGLKKKNIINLKDRPLIAYTIEAALQSKFIDKVIVSTDDEEIAEVAKKYGAEVPFIRPKELATDTASSIDVVKHAISFLEVEMGLEVDCIVLLQPTSPLRTSFDIDKAVEAFFANKGTSLQSVSPATVHPYWIKTIINGELRDFIKDTPKYTRRQDLPEAYQLNGAIYICKRDLIFKENSLVGSNNIPYIMPADRSVDIDNKTDLKLAEFLINERLGY